MARVKFDGDGKGGTESLGMENCSINILDGSELKLACWTKQFIFWKQFFIIFNLSGTSIFKVRDVLH